MQKSLKKIVSLLLALSMCLASFGFSAIGADEPESGPAITSVAYDGRIINLVSGYAANIPVTVATQNADGLKVFAGLFVDGVQIGQAVDVTGGSAVIKAPAFTGSTAFIRAWIDSEPKVEDSISIPVKEVAAKIWEPAALLSGGKITVSFAEAIDVRNSAVTVDGTAAGFEKTGASEIVIGASGGTAVIAKVKYPELFPSYSFTFTVSVVVNPEPDRMASTIVVKSEDASNVMTVGTASITVKPGTTVEQLLAEVVARDQVTLDLSVTLNGEPVTSGVLTGWTTDVSDGINLKDNPGHVLNILQPSTGLTASRKIEVYDQAKLDDMGPYWEDVKYREIDETVNANTPAFQDTDYVITDPKYAHLVDYEFEERYGMEAVNTSPEEPYGRTVIYYGEAIKAAIAECAANGGGRVVIPATGDNLPDNTPSSDDKGNVVYYTGAVHLKSNVNLYIEEGAELAFVRNRTNEYYPIVLTQYEGSDCYNYSPFIYAFNEKNVAITGKGRLNGQADSNNWSYWKRITNQQNQADRLAGGYVNASTPFLGFNQVKAPVTHRVYTYDGNPAPEGTKINIVNENGETEWIDIPEEAWNADELYLGGVNKYDDALNRSILRPNFIQPYLCENVLIEGVTVNNSPMWIIHPKLCTNVLIRDFTSESANSNNDGCNPDACKNVVIEGGRLNNGDDCMALKSGKNEDGQRANQPVENYIIRRNFFQSGNGGITLGSELGAGARYIFSTDNLYNSARLNTVLRFKTNSKRGPNPIEKMYHKDSVVLRSLNQFLLAQTQYSAGGYDAGDYGGYRPVINGLWVYNFQSNKDGMADGLGINATSGFTIQAYARAPISDIHFKNCTLVGLGDSSASNFSNVRNFELDNVTISPRGADVNGPENNRVYNTIPVKISDVKISDGATTISLDQDKNAGNQALPFDTLTGLTITGRVDDNGTGSGRERSSTVQVFINRSTSATGTVAYGDDGSFTVTGLSLSAADANAIDESGVAAGKIRFISIRASNNVKLDTTYTINGGNQDVAVFQVSVQ